MWNCTANKIILHDPPETPTNWAIGCKAEISQIGIFNGAVEPLGIIESLNNPIASIPSLYEAQLSLDHQVLENSNPDQSTSSDLQTEVSAYPNPLIDNILFIKNLKPNSNIKIYSINGRCILERNNVAKIDVSQLTQGIYFVKIKNNQKLQTIQLIKE